MQAQKPVTKILFIDSDELSFQVRQCIAKVTAQLPPVELFHAHDATEGLLMLENIKPDVVVLDDDSPEERDLFIDSLTGTHPPIVVQLPEEAAGRKSFSDKDITCIPKDDSLDGIHQTLLYAASVATGKPATKVIDKAVH